MKMKMINNLPIDIKLDKKGTIYSSTKCSLIPKTVNGIHLLEAEVCNIKNIAHLVTHKVSKSIKGHDTKEEQ